MTITIYINGFNTEIGDQPLVVANMHIGAISFIADTIGISCILVWMGILTIGKTTGIVVSRAIAKIVVNG